MVVVMIGFEVGMDVLAKGVRFKRIDQLFRITKAAIDDDVMYVAVVY